MVEKFINKNARCIGSKHCLECGYPVQVEAYKVGQAQKMLEEYERCSKCGSLRWGTPKVEVRIT